MHNYSNPTAQKLMQIIQDKQTNLAVAADVTTATELLRLAEILGPYICVFKTHIDIISDYDETLPKKLRQLADKHRFLIFEDRKFADIGNTVKHQYRDGIYRISSWADIINAHSLPGPGIIEGLKEVGMENGRGLLLLAEFSSQGALTDDDYAKATVAMAEKHSDFVFGFIAQRRLSPHFIHMTPGVNLGTKGDSLGQQYNTPEAVIERGADVIIVGRGIIAAKDPQGEAERYRQAGWSAYNQRLAIR